VWPLILKLAMDQHTFRIWLKHENMKKFTRLRVLKIIVPSSPGKTRQLSKRNNKEPNLSDYGLGAREEYKTYSNTKPAHKIEFCPADPHSLNRTRSKTLVGCL
jgi:hypothetical protein